MPKFLVIDAETEVRLDALTKSLNNPLDDGRFDTREVDAPNMLRAIYVALAGALRGDQRVTFERISEGWAFRVNVKHLPTPATSSYVVRIQKERA